MLTHQGNLNRKRSSVQVDLAHNVSIDAHQLVAVHNVPLLVSVEEHFQTIGCFSWKFQSMVDIESTIMRWTFTAPARSCVIPVDEIGATRCQASLLTSEEYDAPSR